MRVKELLNEEAMLDGRHVEPKKVLLLMVQSLNNETGFDFQPDPSPLVRDEQYWGEFEYQDVRITIAVSWKHASINKPTIKAWITSSHMSEEELFHYRVEVSTESIDSMWDEVGQLIDEFVNATGE